MAAQKVTRTVFVHAGMHKTGTTSIQHYLAENTAYFDDLGIGIVGRQPGVLERNKAIRPAANCIDVAHCIIRPELMTPVRLRHVLEQDNTYSAQKRRAQQINKALLVMPQARLIASAEAFSFLRRSSEREIFDIVFEGFNTEVILFLREKKSWMTSWRKQTANLHDQFGNAPRDHDSIFDYSPSSWLLDFDALEAFFAPQCRVINYEEALERHGSSVPAFLDAIGLVPTECPPWDGFWRNVSD